MIKRKFEIVIWIVFLITGYFWIAFYSKSPLYFVSSAGFATAYYVIAYVIHPIFVKNKRDLVVSKNANNLGQVAGQILIGLATIGFVWSIVSKSLVLEGRNEIALIAILLSFIASGYLMLTFLWQNWKWSGEIVFRVILFLLLNYLSIGISDGSLVKWQYRDYPQFIQTFECWELDPDNAELQHALKREHMRIVLTEQEFKIFETQHKLEIRGKNSW